MTIPAALPATTAPDRFTGDEVGRIRDELTSAAATREQQLILLLAGADDVVTAQRDTLEQTVAEIRSALRRLDEGTYGRCTRCRDTIPLERLEFRPWAATCIPCARR